MNKKESEFQINDETNETDKQRANRIFTYSSIYIIFTGIAIGALKLFEFIGPTKNFFLGIVLGWSILTMVSWVFCTLLITLGLVFEGDLAFILVYLVINKIVKPFVMWYNNYKRRTK